MERRKYCYYLLGSAIAFASCLFMGCTEHVDDPEAITAKFIVINYSDTVIDVHPKPVSRGAKVTTGGISCLGVSASVYPAANSYTSAGCGSYFYKEAVASGTPTKYYWPTSDTRMTMRLLPYSRLHQHLEHRLTHIRCRRSSLTSRM